MDNSECHIASCAYHHFYFELLDFFRTFHREPGTWRLLPQEPEATRHHRAAHEGVSAADHQSGPQLPREICGPWEKLNAMALVPGTAG